MIIMRKGKDTNSDTSTPGEGLKKRQCSLQTDAASGGQII